jgi:hypothetical protein
VNEIADAVHIEHADALRQAVHPSCQQRDHAAAVMVANRSRKREPILADSRRHMGIHAFLTQQYPALAQAAAPKPTFADSAYLLAPSDSLPHEWVRAEALSV